MSANSAASIFLCLFCVPAVTVTWARVRVQVGCQWTVSLSAGQRSFNFTFDAALQQGRFLRLDLLLVARFMRLNAAERLMSELSELPWEGLERFLRANEPARWARRIGSNGVSSALAGRPWRGCTRPELRDTAPAASQRPSSSLHEPCTFSRQRSARSFELRRDEAPAYCGLKPSEA
jgi:hypothetical protein